VKRRLIKRQAPASGILMQYDNPKGKILLIAFHFPPVASSTGHLRTLGFMKHLPLMGWEPFVLTAHPRSYVSVDPDGLKQVPESGVVRRAFALDVRRHLSLKGKYPSMLALPDRWVSWWPDAVRVGLKLIREHRIDAIWSTYPIATAHLVALSLSRRTALPWIADFRDPMKPSHDTRSSRSVSSWLEKRVMRQASLATFTTPGARQRYAACYPAAADKLRVISNGYEEELFASLPAMQPTMPGERVTLLHSGLLYPQGRSPIPFFQALARLKSVGEISRDNLRVILRASGYESEYNRELKRLDLSDIVFLEPPVSYTQALVEQARSDALLLFQGEEFNAQIPAKVYEYLRIGLPVLALTDARGDTAALLKETGGAVIVPLIDESAIVQALETFIPRLRAGDADRADPLIVDQYSRKACARSFASILDNVVRENNDKKNANWI